MRTPRRFVLPAVAVTALAIACAAAEAARPGTLADNGLDFWNLPSLTDELRTQEVTEARFEQVLELTRIRMALKQQVFEDALAGRLTLAEAARAYREVEPELTAHRMLLKVRTGPVPTDEQIALRAVLGGARILASERDDPEAAARVAALEAEASAGDL